VDKGEAQAHSGTAAIHASSSILLKSYILQLHFANYNVIDKCSQHVMTCVSLAAYSKHSTTKEVGSRVSQLTCTWRAVWAFSCGAKRTSVIAGPSSIERYTHIIEKQATGAPQAVRSRPGEYAIKLYE
jgi:hypothetical protein